VTHAIPVAADRDFACAAPHWAAAQPVVAVERLQAPAIGIELSCLASPCSQVYDWAHWHLMLGWSASRLLQRLGLGRIDLMRTLQNHWLGQVKHPGNPRPE